MKYQRIRRFPGDIILARVTAANREEKLCTMAMEGDENVCILDYILQSREHEFLPPNRSEPTQAQPGTSEKLEVMTERYRSGQPLHNSRDTACLDRRNGSKFYYEILDQKTKI